jgi:CheY-like chemotaxis protein
MKRFVILLVYDEERILNFLKTKLKLLAYKVILARNGIEVLEQVHGQEPDLVMLDVMMPKKMVLKHSKSCVLFQLFQVLYSMPEVMIRIESKD